MDTPLRLGLARTAGALAAGLGLCIGAAAQAADADEVAAAPPRLQLEVQHSAVHLLPLHTPRAGVPGWQAGTQAMAWARRDRVAVGLGVEQRWPAAADAQGTTMAVPPRDANLLLGVAVDAGAHTRLSWQRPLHTGAGAAVDPFSQPQPPQARDEMRLALTMRNRDALKDLRRGMLMKVELASGTLAVKPRHGRLALTFSSQW